MTQHNCAVLNTQLCIFLRVIAQSRQAHGSGGASQL